MGFPFVLSLLLDHQLFTSLILKFITTKEFEQIFFLVNIPEENIFSLETETWGHGVRRT